MLSAQLDLVGGQGLSRPQQPQTSFQSIALGKRNAKPRGIPMGDAWAAARFGAFECQSRLQLLLSRGLLTKR